MRINAVVNACERTEDSLAFVSNAGQTFVSLRDNGNLVFANADTGQHMYQEVFVVRHRWDLFEPSDTVPAIRGADVPAPEDDLGDPFPGVFPELDDVLDWANDPDTSDDELQAYLAEVAGQSDRKRKRKTHLKLIAEYVDSQA